MSGIDEIVAPSCHLCPLQGRPLVNGTRERDVDVLIIGEAPGVEEASKGTPFVGYSGQLVRKYLALEGITSVAFTNVCLCRPKDNATPTPAAINSCRARLLSEINYVRPKKILCLGSIASEALVGKKITSTLNRYLNFNGIPTLCTYHPAAVLRMPDLYRDFADGLDKLSSPPKWWMYKIKEDGYPWIDYELIQTVSRLKEVLNSWDDAWTVDIETNMKEWYLPGAKIILIGLMPRDSSRRAYIIPRDLILSALGAKALKSFFGRDVTYIAHNAPFERAWIKMELGVTMENMEDTLLMHYALDERSGSDEEGASARVSVHSLGYLGGLYYDLPDWKDLMKPYKKDYSTAPLDLLCRYLAIDLWTEDMLYNDLGKQLSSADESGPYKAYSEVMLPAINTLGDMHMEGIPVDKEYLAEVSQEWLDLIEEKCEEIDILAGRSININSPKQLSEFIFGDLKLPRLAGNSVDKKVLDALIKKTGHPALGLIKEARQLRHIRSTYLEGLQERITPAGLVHTDFLIHGTDTGRLSSRNPNLQNQPARIGGLIRDAFVAPPGWTFIESDYKQLEFRVLAHLSLDEALIDYINHDRDIHSEVASQFFNIPVGTETDQQRITTKAFVFGVIYQRGVASIVEEYGISQMEGQRRHGILYGMFPGIKSWMSHTMDTAIRDGFCESVFGRRRRFPFITSRNRADILRYSVNSPIQSTASDINLVTADLVRQYVRNDRIDWFKSLLLVHDSHLAMVRQDRLADGIDILRGCMEHPILEDSPVKFKVDVKVGPRWGSMQKVKVA